MKRTGVSATRVLLLGAACLFVASCGIDADKVSISAATTTPSTSATTTPVIVMPSTPPTTDPPPISADDLVAVAANVQEFWKAELPDVYQQPYDALPSNRIIAGTPSATYPVCDGDALTYKDVEGNAFAAPCPEGLTVVWDASELIPSIDQKYGPVAAAVVLAHEWGHIAQFEADVRASTVILEQQADCFAGVWLKHLIDDPGELKQLSMENPLDSAVSSIIEFRDAPGSSTSDPGAHGSGFDRVRALQEGYLRGGDYCAGYPDKAPPLIQLHFDETNPNDTGNLALDDLAPLVANDLNAFYNKIFDSMGLDSFAGASGDAILGDENARGTLEGLSSRIGDNAAGVVMGMIWASFAQQQVKKGLDRDPEGLLQQQACMAGGWLANVYNDTGNPDRELQLSPGDLDEAILGLIDLGGNQGMNKNTAGAVFQLVGSLRQGVVDGFTSCGLGK